MTASVYGNLPEGNIKNGGLIWFNHTMFMMVSPLVICYSLLLKMAIEIVDFAKMDKNCDFSSSLCKRVPEGKAN